MGHPSIVHGYIYGRGEYANEHATAIAALPEQDARPYLTRDMFALPSLKHSYYDQLISFGLVYNRVEGCWPQWLEKFEALLRAMHWDVAHVYLETDLWGSYHFVWERSSEEAGDPPGEEWKFTGGPRSGLDEKYVTTE